MAIPNTSSGWGLQDVVDEVNPPTDDLQTCFELAWEDGFDPLYSGSKNALLNFRNYVSPYITLNYSSLLFAGNGTACLSGTISVLSNTSWTVSITSAFLTSPTSSGTGNGTIAITCASNPDEAERYGSILVENETIDISDDCSITQLAKSSPCM